MDEKIFQRICRLYSEIELIRPENCDMNTQLAFSRIKIMCKEIVDSLKKNQDPVISLDLEQSVQKEKKKKNLLLVDDDLVILKYLKFALRKYPYNTESIDNPIEAINFLKKNVPDIIVLDIMMPEMTGFEFMQILNSHPKRDQIKVIVGSSRSFDQDRVTMLNLGAHDFISKPYNIEELVARLEKLAS